MVTAMKGQESVTRNSSFFKRYHHASAHVEAGATPTLLDSDGEDTAEDLICTPGSESMTTWGDLQEENLVRPGSSSEGRERNNQQESTGLHADTE
ncbi:hypothetical protein NDU88_000716 [Pleurodeles waltl]|uniref:Uncharacterized protein n=1 Tax=Pleurodeles waltl TaxID=8319 RepID=A0AAV7Q7R9_PLEWA|nr:hypothetical protein NDU88_000716 [Pleurodeles waltl]